MPKSKSKSKSPLSSSEDTKQAFYEALQHADLDRLMACWADEDDIGCVYHCSPRLIGHTAILEAFDALFANGKIKAEPEKVRSMDAGGCNVNNVSERVGIMSNEGPQQAWVLATNVYTNALHGWRLATHHASPGSRTEALDILVEPTVLH